MSVGRVRIVHVSPRFQAYFFGLEETADPVPLAVQSLLHRYFELDLVRQLGGRDTKIKGPAFRIHTRLVDLCSLLELQPCGPDENPGRLNGGATGNGFFVAQAVKVINTGGQLVQFVANCLTGSAEPDIMFKDQGTDYVLRSVVAIWKVNGWSLDAQPADQRHTMAPKGRLVFFPEAPRVPVTTL
jgi:hypothetical protein